MRWTALRGGWRSTHLTPPIAQPTLQTTAKKKETTTREIGVEVMRRCRRRRGINGRCQHGRELMVREENIRGRESYDRFLRKKRRKRLTKR